MMVRDTYGDDHYVADLYIGYHRYEKLRKFNVNDFSKIFELNIDDGYRFDDLVDAWPDLPKYKKYDKQRNNRSDTSF